MSSHMPKPFHCSDCGKEFSKEKTLISHFKVHATDKSYKCEVCKTTFYTKTLYKNHLRTHTKKENHPCPKCGKVFVRSSWLKRHISLQCDEIKQRENKFMCKDCGKSYDSLTGVKSHLIRGKHSETEFRCHECSWTCTSSKTLFVHILQHNNVDVIVVGYSEERRLEYYSTAKVRSKLAKYQPRAQVVSQQEKSSEVAEIPKDSSELSETTKKTPTESMSQNMMLTAKNSVLNTSLLSNEESTHLKDDNSHSQSLALTENAEDCGNGKKLSEQNNIQVINLDEENGQNLDTMLRNGWVKARLPSDRKNIFENKFRESLEKQTAIYPAHEATVSKEKHTLPTADEIPKKMPKLLCLYPEEETSPKESTDTGTDRSSLMQNDAVSDRGILYNHIPMQMNTLLNNQLVMPFSTPLINTMFLPPLFIVPNTVPVTHGFSQQPPMQIQKDTSEKILMHRDTYESHLKGNELAENNSPDTCKVLDDEEILFKSRGKQLETEVHKLNDQAKQPIQDVAEEKFLVHNSSENSKGWEIQDRKLPEEKERKAKEANDDDDMLLDKKVSIIVEHIKNQLNEKQEAQNKCITVKKEIMTSDKQIKNDSVDLSKNDNHLWDTLMGSESNTKSVVHSKHLSLYDIFQPSGQSEDSPDGRESMPAMSEENSHRKIKGRAAVRNKQPGPMGGIDVEDYIKKFMWF